MYGIDLLKLLQIYSNETIESVASSTVYLESSLTNGFTDYSEREQQCVDELCEETVCVMSDPVETGGNALSVSGMACFDEQGNGTEPARVTANVKLDGYNLKWKRSEDAFADAIDLGPPDQIYADAVSGSGPTGGVNYECKLEPGYFEPIQYQYWGLNGLHESLESAQSDEPYVWLSNDYFSYQMSGFDDYGSSADYVGSPSLEVKLRNNTGVGYKVVLQFSVSIYGYSFEPSLDRLVTAEVELDSYTEELVSFDNEFPEGPIFSGSMDVRVLDVLTQTEGGVWESVPTRPDKYQLVRKVRPLVFSRRGHQPTGEGSNGMARYVSSGCYESGYNPVWGFRDFWNDKYGYELAEGHTSTITKDIANGHAVVLTGGEGRYENFAYYQGWYSSDYFVGKPPQLPAS